MTAARNLRPHIVGVVMIGDMEFERATMPSSPDFVNVAMLCAVKTSVLMTVYAGDDPAHFDVALRSVVAQRAPADQIVLVCDGPLGEAHERVIERAIADGAQLDVLRLTANVGLIGALNAGLDRCAGELVFRMDADDVSLPDRFGVQREFMEEHPEIGVLGTAMNEFDLDPQRPVRMKPVPETHDEIVRRLPVRNPVNHPTVCFRRELVSADGYPALRFVEDYFLWAQLINRGVRFHNLQAPLVAYRFDAATIGRRSGWTNFRNEMALRWWMHQRGMLGLPGFVAVGVVQAIVRFAPAGLQRWLWRLTRRRTA